MLAQVIAHAEDALEASAADEASARFFHSVEPLGASYLQTRVYRRPGGPLTPSSHWAAGGLVKRIAAKEWDGTSAFNYVCFDCNPLLGAIREGRTRYRFSDFAPHRDRRFGTYWEALGEAGIGEALCATSYGPDGKIASLHLGFSDPAPPPDHALALQLAGLMLTEHLLTLVDPPAAAEPVRLTQRERDSLMLVADGKTDWEISVIFGIAEATARFHVDNARRKLGAVSRAQAVARMANRRMI
jgi:DNA-binding CsgD family transcriptional regulator